MDESVFANGLSALGAKDYDGAARDFDTVLNSIDMQDAQYNRVASYLGLARSLLGDDSGLLLCRDAASNETVSGDVFLNIACAEWHAGQRKRAIDAIHRGLEIAPDHQKLHLVLLLMDSRKRAAISFLDRDHILNRFLGRFLRRKSREMTVHTLIVASRV